MKKYMIDREILKKLLDLEKSSLTDKEKMESNRFAIEI